MTQNPAPEDRASPQLRRDLFFGDLALIRRETLTSAIVAGTCLVGLAVCYFSGVPEANRVAALTCLGPALFFSVRIRSDWRVMRATADGDAELTTDPRFVGEVGRGARVRAVARAVNIAGMAAVVSFLGLAAWRAAAEARAWFQASPPPTVELVDVTLVNGPADFSGRITIDVTGDRITRIAPYDVQRALDPKGERIRTFEALGTFAVGGTLDLSRPDPLDYAKRDWMRPIDIERRGDLIVLDIDPRTHDVTLNQVAAAVVNGRYLSREDIRRAASRR